MDGLRYWEFTKLGQHTGCSVEARPKDRGQREKVWVQGPVRLGQHLRCSSRNQTEVWNNVGKEDSGRLTRLAKYIGCVAMDKPSVEYSLILDNVIFVYDALVDSLSSY